MNVAIVRGKYLNQFEMQNYAPLKRRFKITAFASLLPIHKNIGLPIKKLPSPMDLPNFPFKLPILNRLMVDAMYLVGLEKALKGFDLACTREAYFHFTKQALIAKKKGYVKKVLITCSETIPGNHEGIWRRKAFKKRAIREADHFHCLTQKAKDCLVEEGCDPEKITVAGYGIDLNKFQVASFKRQDKKQLRLLFVGRLVEEKGILDLLETFKSFQPPVASHLTSLKLRRASQSPELQIIGKGPLEKIIRKKCPSMIQKKVPYKNMPKVYQSADIFVLPSKPTKHWEEYYGMALIEAMACGLPIVSTKSGAIHEVVGNAGILVKPGNVRQLRKALGKLIEDKSLRNSLGRKARKRAEKYFDAKKQAVKLGKLWRKVLKK